MSQTFVQCNVHMRPAEKERVQHIAKTFNLSMRELFVSGAEILFRLKREESDGK